MFRRRCRILQSPLKPCLYVVVGAVLIWIIVLFANSVSRGRTERHFKQRHEPVLMNRRERHMKALNAEIKALIARPALNWTAFLRGPVADNFKTAPCSCGGCGGTQSLPQCRSPTLLGNITKQVRREPVKCPYEMSTYLKVKHLLQVLEAQQLKLPNPYAIPASPGTLPGGMFRPSCNGKRLAIIIPFRDRWSQLKTLLTVLQPMLQRQQLCYRVFVVEQHGCQAFNKGRLNNAGFLEASKRFKFDCVIFQDADIVPLDDRNLYYCHHKHPKHMAVAVDVHRFRLPYNSLVGGVIAFQTQHYVR